MLFDISGLIVYVLLFLRSRFQVFDGIRDTSLSLTSKAVNFRLFIQLKTHSANALCLIAIYIHPEGVWR